VTRNNPSGGRRRGGARTAIPSASYHGAHKPTVNAPAVQRWEGGGCVAFVHDLMSSPALPGEYVDCDVLVADLPWQVGFETFNQRAGLTDGRSYASFMARVSEIVEATTVPVYLVTGKHALPKLPTPDVALPMRLNEDEAVAYGYRPGGEADGGYGVTQEFLYALAQRYAVAGDFCCGYGRTGRFFLRSGKRAVLSDFNAQCIGYIAEHADAWVRDLRR
jgi:hypothetical protein